jgi:hypothetical protein
MDDRASALSVRVAKMWAGPVFGDSRAFYSLLLPEPVLFIRTTVGALIRSYKLLL